MNWKLGDKFAIVIVGDEFTHGESNEENGPWVARRLVACGFKVELCLQMGDDPETISYWLSTISQSSINHIVICGGIGGTHDDHTREAVARALNSSLVMHPECMRILENKYADRLNDQRRRMAYLPSGCKLIYNDQGAPGFSVANLTVLPGFPRMVKKMLNDIISRLDLPCQNHVTLQATFENMTEGDIAVEVEEFNHKWRSKIQSLGIYPDAREGVRAVTLKLRSCYTKADDIEEHFKRLVNSLGGKLEPHS